MMTVLAIFAGATLTFLPLGMLVRRLVTDSAPALDMPPIPAGSLEH